MALHRLTSVCIGVPNVAETGAYYEEFGLTRLDDNRFATVDGGEQLRIVHSPRRRVVELGIGVADPDDLDSVAARLAALGGDVKQTPNAVAAVDPGTEVLVVVSVAKPITQAAAPPIAQNAPGQADRGTGRAEPIDREDDVRPRKLGHVVLGSTDLEASERFFIDGVGFKVSDTIGGAASFLRCSTDHHNLLVQAAPVSFLHHTSWQVDDVDEIGRGATALLNKDPTRHVWGLGRHDSGPTSSGTSRTPRATSASTTPTWTASSTTSSGILRSGTTSGPSIAGDLRCQDRSSPPTTWAS